MKMCSAKPYEGNDKYIFISYCHKDKKYVFPIIEYLVRDGYRVWYDEGIDPGTEWPEIIAYHLNGCAACIAFISDNSLNSHNCRREINFALFKKKPFISVVLESVKMSLGMEMQLSATQSIFKYMLPDEKDFYKKLYDAKILQECLGEPDSSVIISKPEDYDTNIQGMFASDELKRDTFSDTWFVNDNKAEETGTKVESVIEMAIEPESYAEVLAYLIRRKTNEKIMIKNGLNRFGRSEKKCDYAIVDNNTVSRIHATINYDGAQCVLTDNDSMNKTYLNQEELKPEQEYVLKDGDTIRFANEQFFFHLS